MGDQRITPESAPSRPNFLFILIDDMGWRDLSCQGSTFYETPHIDRIAKEGMRFTDAYAACPVCSPTRASLLTGKYPATLGMTHYVGAKEEKGKVICPPYVRFLSLEERTIATTLKASGYRTYHVGKWHLGAEPYWPEHHGFDVNIGGCHWGSPRTYFSPYGNPKLSDGPAGEYLTDRLTDEAIKLIKANGTTPFFMYLSHYAVHIPIQVPEKYIQKYRDKAHAQGLDQKSPFQVGDYFVAEHKKKYRITRRMVQSDVKYAAMIENLDENVGKLLQALEDCEQLDNTAIIFYSDNGGLSTAEGSPTCNLPLIEGKGWMYEGGIRDPLLIRYPKIIRPGSICREPVTSPDFYPTFLELAGLPLVPQQHQDGVSFLPLLKGDQQFKRESIFFHFPHYANQGGSPACAVRNGDWKLIEFFDDMHVELYNLREDMSEAHNVADAHPEIVDTLRVSLNDWQNRIHAQIPKKNPKYRRNWRQILLELYKKCFEPKNGSKD